MTPADLKRIADTPGKLRLSVAINLFTTRLRGDIAGLFLARGEAPSERWLAIIRGEHNPTMRDLAELAHDLGADIVFVQDDKRSM